MDTQSIPLVSGFARAALLAVALLPISVWALSPQEAQSMIERAQVGAEADSHGALTLPELMKALGVPGVSVAIVQDYEIHWANAYGVADIETGEPVDTQTLFQAASISKPVAAMASLLAVQQGKFALDDNVNSILTSWQLDGEGMTERRAVTPAGLMSHTSGLGDAFGFPGYEPGEALPTTIQILEGTPPSNVRRIFMEREPGVAYEYSGGGVTLQQLVLTDVRKKAFAQIMRDDVLGPLGMNNSTYEQPLPADWAAKAARAHSGDGESMGPKWHVYPELAAAGMWTTPSDLARFAIEVQRSVRGESNRVLDVDHARRMITPVGVGSFAIGLAVERIGEGWYFSHGGANWGFRADVVGHLSNGYGLAIMTNSDSGGTVINEITKRVQHAYDWDAIAEPVPRGYRAIDREVVMLPRDELAKFVGVYTGEETLTVSLGDNGLLVRNSSGGRDAPLYASSTTGFFLKVMPVTMDFVLKDSKVTGMILVTPDGEELALEREGE